ncbi:MAG TPA: hypothetical protein VHB98_22735 [Chloroflexota bacterium]|nr:hypothetical protein [Chloroflexota bacterium]
MAEQEVFILAERALQHVIDQIRDDQWDMEMPPTFARQGQGPVTLRTIVNYHAYDDAWVPAMLAGKAMDEVGKTTYDGDLLGDDPRVNFARFVESACAAARDCQDLDCTVHLTYGDYPAREYFWHITYFRGLRVYDLALVIGVDTTMPSDLVQGLWDELSPHAEQWRAIGVFGPAVAVPDDADPQTKLLALTGRHPVH